MRLTWTKVDEAIPRFELDQDTGIQIEQWGIASWSCYVDGQRFGEAQNGRHYAEELAANAWMRRFAAKVAAELGARRNEAWAVEVPEEPYVRSVVITTGIARLKLSYDSMAAEKVNVSGGFPDGFGHKTFAANVDPARGPHMVAAEAERRVLAAGYADELLVVLERKRVSDEHNANRAALMARAAALFGIETEDPGDGGKLFLHDWLTGSGYVEPYGGNHDDRLTFQLSGIDGEVALAMLQVLAVSRATAPCCHKWGLSHHPALSEPGCARTGPVTEPKPFSREADALFDVYRADKDPERRGLGWETWVLSFGPEPVTHG
jgi:hypothetical protein